MDGLLAILFIFVVYTIGDIVASATKSIVPSMFVCSALFLVGFWTGVPGTLFQDSQMYTLGSILITCILVHMGSMLNLNQLKQQWRTVLIAVGAIAGIVALLLTVGRAVVGFEAAVVAAPPISGGVIAGLQMSEAAKAIGRTDLQLMATLLVVLQGFIGFPLASFCLRKEAKSILALKAQGHVFEVLEDAKQTEARSIFTLPQKYTSANYFMAKTLIIAYIATLISGALAGIDTGLFFVNAIVRVDKNVLALILGIVFAEVGVIERRPLEKANAFGFVMAALMTVIYGGLAGTTPTDVVAIVGTIVITLIIGTVGIGIVSILVGKVVGVGPWMAFGIGASALFGFPGTFIVSNEVASAVAQNPEEEALILSQILPKMLVSGFVTVSIGSVIIAGFLAPLVLG
ncbi:hypothetical protein O6R05_06520 [Peptoniphilus equinus]|uniref:Na+/glutamate symporter n=1 Tax=Peptoniphilus equinus TaxID=3016343 RepID=A0ABY7QU92_9FIRM|nr:hypothetical protein [Peptoniphilus equinus]WBW49649.1 hypothetical protein O6R05_06520 [Peptoniphilus equinus]